MEIDVIFNHSQQVLQTVTLSVWLLLTVMIGYIMNTLSVRFGSAPRCSRSRTTLALPLAAASIRGVLPFCNCGDITADEILLWDMTGYFSRWTERDREECLDKSEGDYSHFQSGKR